MHKITAIIITNHGSFYFVVVVFVLLSLMLSGVTHTYVHNNNDNTVCSSQNTQSFYIAEAGLESANRALAALNPTQFYEALQKQPIKKYYQSSNLCNGIYQVTFTGNFNPKYTENQKGILTISKKVDIRIEIIASQIKCYKNSTKKSFDSIPVYLYYSLDGGKTWNKYKNGKKIEAGDSESIAIGSSSGSKFAIKVIADGAKTTCPVKIIKDSQSDQDFILPLKLGDKVPAAIIDNKKIGDQSELIQHLDTYVDAQNCIKNIQLSDVLYLCEIGNESYKQINKAAYPETIDYQDAVLVVVFDPTPYETQNYILTSTGTVKGATTKLQLTGVKSYSDNSIKITSWKEN